MKTTTISLAIALITAAALANEPPDPTASKQPELREELLRRMERDQKARKAMMQWLADRRGDGAAINIGRSKEEQAEYAKRAAAFKAVDDENKQWLKGVVEQHGWPTRKLVGRDGANAAWLLVQHADADPKFQRRCLDLMTKLPKGEVAPSNLAYLTDRVLLAEGKKQRYGTQFKLVGGKWQPRPIEDESNVDQRRSEVGLPPLSEYRKLIDSQFSTGPKK